ncbi:MAG: trypsin-like peptidase domain-containing protein [Planctomycetes bacterium]|nr:trypsin-like peptidase domain-containing protein [Planctomycetota bacterium]
MQIELIHLDGPKRGLDDVRPEKEVVLGTAASAQIRYPEDGIVAPEHALVRFHEEGCSFHAEALDGRVFVNGREIQEIILVHGDLIELGADGPRLRFRVHARPGEVCKPIRQMIRDASDLREQRGILRATRSLGRDFVFRSSWKVKLMTPILMATVIFAAAFLGGHLASSRAAREAAESRRLEEENRLSEMGRLRGYIARLEEAQRRLVDKEEIGRIRSELEHQRELVGTALAEDQVMAEVLERYSASVCLIHGIYGFTYEKGGKTTDASYPGGGPLEIEYTGSGFLASAEGRVLTNRHVAEPWWQSDDVARFIDTGFKPVFRRLDVLFPGRAAIAVDPASIRISGEDVDLASLLVEAGDVPVVPIEDGPLESYRGRRVVLLGYPTGVGALLARAERDEFEAIFKTATDLTSVIEALAERKSISPIITQGALNEVKERRLVYDAATTSGGSGGPVFGPGGRVIGVNFAITRDFDGSNFGVPIGFAKQLLQP